LRRPRSGPRERRPLRGYHDDHDDAVDHDDAEHHDHNAWHHDDAWHDHDARHDDHPVRDDAVDAERERSHVKRRHRIDAAARVAPARKACS
jgi:hypothetical protein